MILGLVKDSIQAELIEVEFIQEGPMVVMVGLFPAEGQGRKCLVWRERAETETW